MKLFGKVIKTEKAILRELVVEQQKMIESFREENAELHELIRVQEQIDAEKQKYIEVQCEMIATLKELIEGYELIIGEKNTDVTEEIEPWDEPHEQMVGPYEESLHDILGAEWG